MHIERHLTCDVLVVGTGLAGLRAAYDVAADGLNVLVISKGRLCSGASFYPLTGGLGAQLPRDAADKNDYLEELLDSGDGIADEHLCHIMVDEITDQVGRLPQLGIEVAQAAGRPACFAKRERILKVWRNWDRIRKNVTDIFSSQELLTVMQHCDVLKLLHRDNRIIGALLIDNNSQLVYVKTSTVILATGGYCGLYKHSLNTDDVCGIGHSVALEAGAELINLEFMQFIPGLTAPVYKLLFGEISLWHCQEILDQDRKPALRAFLPEDVSLEQCIRDRSMHGPFTTRDNSKYLELAIMKDVIEHHREQGFIIRYKQSINEDSNELVASLRKLYADHDIDLAKQEISIAPFAHCANGGISIDEHACTSVHGLFAAGEAAGGIHGADRHGGAATAVCLVFGARAANAACTYSKQTSPPEVLSDTEIVDSFMQWIDTKTNSSISPHDVLHTLREQLWLRANVLRSKELSLPVLNWIEKTRKAYNAARAIESGYDVKLSMQAFHALRTSESLLKAILRREESRGPHYRADFPNRNEALTGKRIKVSEKDHEIIVSYEEGKRP
ncbi:MAG: FAD-binding protein [Sphaerochaetaceae bacterium]|nr:FAD-binding protein [Sphaerochaetaceae bacterium]NLO61542.1 FAD-binding protein [Spirochaetales bacterium]